MSWIVLLLISTMAALLDAAYLGVAPVLPHAGLAVAAWVLVRTYPKEMPVRLWLVGVVLDAADPFSTVYYSVSLLLLGVLLLPLRHLVFARSIVAWGMAGFVLVFLIQGLDVLLGGAWNGGVRGTMAAAYGTALLAMAGGWLLDVLPPAVHPCGRPVA